MRLVRLWRTRRPTTFREKVRYKMLRDHRPLIVTFADKAAVRDHVAERVGAHVLPEAYAVLDDPSGLLDLELPASYVVKPTHGSGACVVVSPAAPADAVLPPAGTWWGYSHVRPDAVTRDELAATARFWSSKLYGQGPNREWAYGLVPPRVIVEEKLGAAPALQPTASVASTLQTAAPAPDDTPVAHGGPAIPAATDDTPVPQGGTPTAPPGDGIPDDYKLFVFHGRCRFIQVDAGRFGGRTQDFFDAEWNHLPMSGGPAWADPEPPRPARFDEMISIAERLGQDTDFVRVDLYHLPDRVVFGELTSYPAGGDSPFDPESFDLEFGRHWTVPRRYR